MKLLYDYWFTQFDFPDENGKPYKSSGGKMVWNKQLSQYIPLNWSVKSLNELLFKNHVSYNYNFIEPTIDLSVMTSSNIALCQLNTSDMFSTNLFQMKEGDILFGSIRPYLKKAGIAPCDGAVAGTVHSFNVFDKVDYNFALFTLCKDSFFDYAIRMSTGTKMPVVSSDNVLSYKVPYSSEISRLFNTIDAGKIICKNTKETQQLVNLRDWLLPMLMNGLATVE